MEAAGAGTEPDTLNEIGVLRRREIEARIVAPLLDRLGEEFGDDAVRSIARDVVIDIARSQGALLARLVGGTDLESFASSLDAWTMDGALEIEVVEQGADVFAFNVTRCRYAEMYAALGMTDLGADLSCNRDATLIEGFNPDVEFRRTQTIMEGAPLCDFVYRLPKQD